MAAFNNVNFGSQFFICAAAPGVGSCSVGQYLNGHILLNLFIYWRLISLQLDAGSPILLNGFQIGISSQARCGGGEPVVGVDVRAYEAWIRRNL